LNSQIRQLPINLSDSIIPIALKMLKNELNDKNIKFKPHFWISDEWFCPDGIPGVAIPFYLTHPKLTLLEKKYIGMAEGEGLHQMMKYLRHETGHAIENAFYLRKNKLRIEVFGTSKIQYPRYYLPKPFSQKFVRNLNDNYSQSHPDEDFAETFAVWLNPDSNWKLKYSNWKALDKLKAMDEIMLGIKNKNPLNNFKGTLAPHHLNKTLVSEYLKLKQKRLKILSKRQVGSFFKNNINKSNCGDYLLSLTLKNEYDILLNVLNVKKDLPKYKLKKILDELIDRSDLLQVKINKNMKLSSIVKIIENKIDFDLKNKRHFIYL
ncbi:MAG: putative zinc-binding metallopeptidase, partial [Leptospiraceae bacterium]|nr:putative zinc-binding metallopeptidase [Leptospiraceae bacterium]